MPKHAIEEEKANSDDVSQAPTSKKTKVTTPSKKSRWTAEEDSILVGMIEEILNERLWEKIKADGRLVERTSYGCQYHAKLLLRQGTGKSPKPKAKDN